MVAFILFWFLLLYLGYCADVDGIKEYTPTKSNKTIRNVLGIVLIVLGSLGCISPLILYMAQDIIQESILYVNIDIDIATGFYLFFIAWGNYIIKFVPSSVKKWQKITKGIGYLFLCIALYILCFIPSFVKDSEPIGFLVVVSLILLLISILLIRLSRKREKIILPHSDIINEKTSVEIEQTIAETTMIFENTEVPKLIERIKVLKSKLTFQQKVNITLFILTGIFLITSVVFLVCFVEEDDDFLWPWLIFSLFAAISRMLWFYFNHNHLTIEDDKKYGLAFLLSGFVLCISPFYALISLFLGGKLIKLVFDGMNSVNNKL